MTASPYRFRRFPRFVPGYPWRFVWHGLVDLIMLVMFAASLKVVDLVFSNQLSIHYRPYNNLYGKLGRERLNKQGAREGELYLNGSVLGVDVGK